TDAIDKLRKKTGKVSTHMVRGWWKDTGRPEDIIHANRMVLSEMQGRVEGIVENEVILDGNITIGEGTNIQNGSIIRGPVIIGKNCTIGPNARIGPYVSIGDLCSVINGEIESSIIMSGTTISCNKRIIDSLIGSGCVIEPQQRENELRVVLGENSRLSS
ncbi:MAG: glucose-1-phosphate thymidylyltransferase, partial [Euryarchaeota archaeon]|nr:glucose-1-phosphate thymidylyltransferase [Euryarchaeota archaeon]